ncbi:restriction endonuclease subunit S [Spiroplasma citri]|uniref:restriction endonuclease subunit S n=1 Tax=Spiroplasma citri TaxID=2133 RepID=UPI00241222EF|nr:restriction endonuclease subunit S [Spiroplasma citri]WFH00414.1 restriction endonuclease subunit S [Spiroplasma citri]
MNKYIVPKIRFKGFNDFYYKTTFNKFYNKGKSGGTPSTKNKDFYNGEISFLSIKDVTNQGKYIFQTEKTITKKGLKNSSAWLVPKNSLIYSIYASVGFPTINKIPLATSQAFFSMEINNLYFSTEYLYYLLLKFKKKELNKFIIKQTQPNLSKEIINQFIFKIPSLQEQTKIANFFTIIDRKIELIKEQLSLLEKQKQYYLNNMFANEKSYPKIRFKGFNDEWKSKKIKELGNIKTGKTPSTKNEKNWLNDVLWITIPDMTKKYLTNSKKKISLMASKKNPIVKEKSILFSCIGTIGNIGITTTITSFNQQINSISSIKDGVEYVYYLFQYNTEKIKSYSSAQTLPMINKNYFENIEIFVSLNYKEQTKIANFFSIIDRKIELIKEQLSLLEKQKQYYLNNMFI